MIKVSMVMSVYNAAKTVEEAIESALSQYNHLTELIIIDDGSSDESASLIQKYAARHQQIVFLQNLENLGAANSLNKAIHVARGEYIMRMDADDINLFDRLNLQASFLDAHSDIGCISCFVDTLFCFDVASDVREKVTTFEQERRPLAQTPERISERLPMQNIFHHGEVMFRKQLWKQVGGYRPELLMAEDYDFWLRMIKLTSFYIIPQVLYIRRFCGNLSSTYPELQDSCALLAKKCYHLRCEGKNDLKFAHDQFLSIIKKYHLEFFSHYIERRTF